MHSGYYKLYILFAIQVVLVGAYLSFSGHMVPRRFTDTASYIDFPTTSLSAALGANRTFVYPLLLNLTSGLALGDIGVVWIQFGAAALSAGFLLWVLLRCEWDGALALAATSPLLYSPMVLEYSSTLIPDLLAQSLGVASIGFWLLVVHRGKTAFALMGIATLVFLAYQCKPSYLFLLVLVPIGGGIARWWLYRTEGDAWLVGIRLAIATWVPFVMFCSLRWLVVGHFGLVSFGGFNIVGITGQLLREDMINEFSSDVRPFAEQLLAQRPQTLGNDHDLSYPTMAENFNPTVWKVAVPIADQLHAGDLPAMNRTMTQFSRELIQNHPRLYLGWLISAARRAVIETMDLTVRNIPVLVAIMVALAVHAWRGWQGIVSGPADVAAHRQSYQHEFQTIVWLALGYAACKFALVILVEPPVSRYSAPATVFLPSIVAMLATLSVKGLFTQPEKS